ncbi:MAG: sugar 3,4-ketoisomerase [Bacteroidales bacterium]
MKVQIIDLPKILDRRGNLSFLEGLNHIPFRIERTHWIYDVPGGQSRGGHAYKVTREFIVALSGSFDVVVNNGQGEERFHMNRSYYGLYLPAGTWRMMDNFSTNSLALVVSSTKYDAEDYIRDFDQFKLLKQHEIQTDSI